MWRHLASNALTLRDYWRFTADDVLLHALPIYHVHGLFVAVNVVLLAGASMLYLPRFDADEVIRLLPKATAMTGHPIFRAPEGHDQAECATGHGSGGQTQAGSAWPRSLESWSESLTTARSSPFTVKR